jgi:hypothetical protein
MWRAITVYLGVVSSSETSVRIAKDTGSMGNREIQKVIQNSIFNCCRAPIIRPPSSLLPAPPFM